MNDKEARRRTPPGEDAATVPAVQPPPAFGLQLVKQTDVGRLRPHNEDYLDAYIPSDPQQLERKGAIFLVADGMGGHQAGEVASKGAVELVIKQYYADTSHDIGTSLVRAFRAANQMIYNQAQADPSKAGMGTTLVAAVVLGRTVYLANVGDSRAYLINEAGINQITEDHSWVEEQVRAGLLSAEQAHRHPQRNLLTRALGSKPAVDVDLFEGELAEGDTLLLCTDGLTGRVEDAEIAAIVQQHPPDEAARLLVAQANERGGNDNITVLMVTDQEEAPTVAAPVPAVSKKPARSLPLIPILGGLAGLLVIALLALLVVPGLFDGDATVTPLPTASPPAGTEAIVPTTAASPTVEVTQVATDTAPPPDTPLPGEPTATLAATYTPEPPTPTPTATVAGLATRTPQPSPTVSSRQDPAPTLLEPTADAEVLGNTTFRWTYSSSLPAHKAFQVLIWRQGELQHNGAAAYVTVTSQTIDLAAVPQLQAGGPGEYFWTVVVVDTRTDERTSPEAAFRPFLYTGPQQQQPRPGQPSPTPDKSSSYDDL